MTDLNQAVVVITGATGGFGRQLTRQLLQAGSCLILSDIDRTTLEEFAAKIKTEVTTGEIIACLESDLSLPESSQNLYDRIKALGKPVDILINNAGIALIGRTNDVPPEKWEKLMQINLLAPMRLSSLYINDAIERRKGHIVNISSVAGWIGAWGMASYNASKFGLRGFSEGLFNDVKKYNIKVTVVYPFFSRTPILESERFGMAKKIGGLPDRLVTDPAKVMERTIKGIVADKFHVFPDRYAKSLYILKQYFPGLLDWISNRTSKQN